MTTHAGEHPGEHAPLGPVLSASTAIGDSLRRFAGRADTLRKGWFTELVASYLRWRAARKAPVRLEAGEAQAERAQAIVREACVKVALSGAAAGSISTGAALLTGETGGSGALFAVPAGLLAIGGEMVLRALVHLGMTCDLADVFGVPFDPEHPDELWRLYALAFHTAGVEQEVEDRSLLRRIVDPQDQRIGADIGDRLLRESVLRNVVPVVGVATSAASSWRLTREVGDTVRRYCRYRRAMRDVLEQHPDLAQRHLALVIEGLWFVFTADGHLSPEEAATLALFLRRLPPGRLRQLENRLVADESLWLRRLKELPPGDREAFLDLLEVAAAVDKAFAEPERQVIERAARALGLERHRGRVRSLIQQLRDVGVLSV